MREVAERLIRYARVYTTSDPKVEDKVPSSERQWDLARLLARELKEMGVPEVNIDEKCFVMAKIPSNLKAGEKAPAIGFISHLDTAPDAKGEGVKPKIHENYQGGILEVGNGVYIDPEKATDLKLYKGHDIMTSDGTTLLGSDDKAGISAIMTAVNHIMKHPELKHGDICIGFTPDEEIGVGGNHFNVKAFGADFAYTLDGETLGEFNYETFSAAEVKVKVQGHNVHPGNAKGIMYNACDIGSYFAALMPAKERPEYTEGYEGFYHLCEMRGDVEYMEMIYIIRDFNKEKLEEKKDRCREIAHRVNEEFCRDIISLDITDEYSNMREVLEDQKEIIDLALKAYKECGVEPIIKPIRGGTDGSKLSFKGLPCPNIFVGGNNFHSVAEFCSIDAVEKAGEIVVSILKNAVE